MPVKNTSYTVIYLKVLNFQVIKDIKLTVSIAYEKFQSNYWIRLYMHKILLIIANFYHISFSKSVSFNSINQNSIS